MITAEEANRAAVEKLLAGIDAGNIGVLDEVFHDDAVMDWPASHEQVRGAENRCAVYPHMPVLPKVRQRLNDPPVSPRRYGLSAL